MLRSLIRAACLLAMCSAGTGGARAQSFSVDIDFQGFPPEIGGGVPSSTFAGPAGMPSIWNSMNAGFQGPLNLVDFAGQPTGVQLFMTGTGGSLGFNNPNISGDYKLLMADAEAAPATGLSYTIQGLASGWYRVYTLALNPNGTITSTSIRVPGSISGEQTVSGSLNSNTFEHLRTHSIHEILVTNGSLKIEARRVSANAYVNGFQLVAVPEPCTIGVLGGALSVFILLGGRRHSG
jgi:hypothetical protein